MRNKKYILLLIAFISLLCLTTSPVSADSLTLSHPGEVVTYSDDWFSEIIDTPAGLEAIQISAGTTHAAALKADGTVVCWGKNNYEQCDVPSGLEAIQVSAGRFATIAIKPDGTVVAWGSNDYGQLNIPSGLVATKISCNTHHCMALKADGTVVCWGDAQHDKCNVPAGLKAVAISAGEFHSMALRADGTVVCWGSNNEGQISVPAGLSASAIAAGSIHNLAVKTDGTIVAWGNNDYSQSSVPSGLKGYSVSGAYLNSVVLQSDGSVVTFGEEGMYPEVPANEVAGAISAGDYHTVIIRKPIIPDPTPTPTPDPEPLDLTIVSRPTEERYAVGWGENNHGQASPPNEKFVQVRSGYQHSAGLKADGTVRVWGLNDYQQHNIPAGLKAVKISGGESHILALQSNGTVVAWGYNQAGQRNVPPDLDNVVDISAAGHHSLALQADGTVIAWGDNGHGQCNVPDNLRAISLGAGLYHSLAIKSDNTVVGWGDNNRGQCDVPAGLKAVSVKGGRLHSLALKTDGTVVAWGNNTYGQCDIPAGTKAIAVSAGLDLSLLLHADGTVSCYGGSRAAQCRVPDNLYAKAISSVSNTSHALIFHKPVSSFTFTAKSEEPFNTVMFSDSSTSEETDIISRLWTFGDGQTSSEKNPVHVYPTHEHDDTTVYTVTLTVTDNLQQSSSISKNVTIPTHVPPAPAPSFSYVADTSEPFNKISFTDTSSSIPGISIVARLWDFGDGNSSSETNPVHLYPIHTASSPKEYTVKLFLTDSLGQTNSSVQKITIPTHVPPAPVPNFLISSIHEMPFNEITFNDCSSSDGGRIVSWYWDFGDGVTSGQRNTSHVYPVHTFDSPERYTVNLTVTDSIGQISSVRKTVQIPTYIPAPLVAGYTYASSTSGIPTDMSFEVKFTDSSSHPDTDIISWYWDFGDGDSSTEQNPTHLYKGMKDFTVSLTVIDHLGQISTYTEVVNPRPFIKGKHFKWTPETGFYTGLWFDREDDFINVEGLFGSIAEPFTAIIGSWFFVVIWGTLVMGLYLHTQDTTLPFVIGILLGSVISVSAGADGITVMYLTMAFAGGGVLAKLLLGRQ